MYSYFTNKINVKSVFNVLPHHYILIYFSRLPMDINFFFLFQTIFFLGVCCFYLPSEMLGMKKKENVSSLCRMP